MRMEYSMYIAYLKAANATIGVENVKIQPFKEEKVNGNRLVTFGIEVSGMPTDYVSKADQLARSIVRATRIAAVMNTSKVGYYYDDRDTITENDMDALIASYKGLFMAYVNGVEQ